MVAYWVTSLLERAAGPSGQGAVKNVIDWLVILLFLFLMARTYHGRRTAEEPRWMGKLQTADAGVSFRLGLPLLGKRAEKLLPRVRDWMTGNSWVISEIAVAFLLALTISGLVSWSLSLRG
jgi:hypothetical protein